MAMENKPLEDVYTPYWNQRVKNVAIFESVFGEKQKFR